MRKGLVFNLILIVMIWIAGVAYAQDPGTGATATVITVAGHYEQEVTPDIANVTVGVATEAATVIEAKNRNAAETSAVYARMDSLGIKKEYIKTTNYSVTPVYRYDEARQKSPQITGYRVTNNVCITVEPLLVGDVIDASLKGGANQIFSISFGKKDEERFKTTALQQAVKNALDKANAIAEALDMRVTKVKSVSESGVHVQPTELGFRALSKSAADTATPISPGLIRLSADVQLVLEIH